MRLVSPAELNFSSITRSNWKWNELLPAFSLHFFLHLFWLCFILNVIRYHLWVLENNFSETPTPLKMLFKKLIENSSGFLLPVGKYQCCMRTQSSTLCLFKGAVFPGMFLFKDILKGFYLMESLQLTDYPVTWKSEFLVVNSAYKVICFFNVISSENEVVAIIIPNVSYNILSWVTALGCLRSVDYKAFRAASLPVVLYLLKTGLLPGGSAGMTVAPAPGPGVWETLPPSPPRGIRFSGCSVLGNHIGVALRLS